MVNGQGRRAITVVTVLLMIAFAVLYFLPAAGSSTGLSLGEAAFASAQPQTLDSDGPLHPDEVNRVGNEPIGPAGRYDIRVKIGDPSGSASERWKIIIGPRTVTSPLGDVKTRELQLDPALEYEIRVVWLESNQSTPDYDYIAEAIPLGSDTLWTVDDPDQLLGTYYDVNLAEVEAKRAYLRSSPTFVVEEIDWGGTGNIEITADINGTTITGPEYFDKNLDGDTDDLTEGEKGFPIAYVPGSTPTIDRILFSVTPPSERSNQQVLDLIATFTSVHGDGPGAMDFDSLQLTSPSDGRIEISNITATGAFTQNFIRYYENPKIQWTFESSTQGTVEAGTSSTPTYIPRQAPPTSLNKVFWTVLDIGCRMANGMRVDAPAKDLRAVIWEEFTDREVRRAQPTVENNEKERMFYYKSWESKNTSVEDLLQNKDGQCGAWAKLLIEVFMVQGVEDGVSNWVVMAPEASIQKYCTNRGFYVSNWTFAAGDGSSGQPGYPYLNVVNMPVFQGYIVPNQTGYNFVSGPPRVA